jgi:hypothetical protein
MEASEHRTRQQTYVPVRKSKRAVSARDPGRLDLAAATRMRGAMNHIGTSIHVYVFKRITRISPVYKTEINGRGISLR